MKKIIIGTVLILMIIITYIPIKKVIDYNSIASKNTRKLEKILSQGNVVNGNVKDLIPFDYDRMIVFLPLLH